MEEKNEVTQVMTAELVVTVNGVKNIYCVTNDLFEGMDDDNSSRPVDERKYILYKIDLGNWSISRSLSPKNGRKENRFVAKCIKMCFPFCYQLNKNKL